MDMKKMMKQAQKMQRDLESAQEEINKMEYQAQSGGGMVSVTVTGAMEIKDITIDKNAVDPNDVEMLQDMIVAAANEALREMNKISQTRLNSVTGSMNLPGF